MTFKLSGRARDREDVDGNLGVELRSKVEHRLRQLETGMTFKLSGRARDMNTTPKYTPVERAPKTYDDGNDFSLESRAGKRKFDQTKTPAKGAADDESGVKDEPLNETAEEVQTSPKKKSKKRLIEEVKEEEAEVANNEQEEEKPEVETEEVVQPVVSEKKKKKKKSLVQ